MVSLNIQSVILEKDYFTFKEAENWIKKHNFKLRFYGKKPDETEKYYRFRQATPSKYKSYRTKYISDGIKFILGK